MPSRPPRICNRCKQPTPSGRPCACRPAFEGSSWKNGSDRRWRNVRAQQLRDHPICQHPDCRLLATDVDHIVPLARGGAKYDRANLQSLCAPHHDEKSKGDALAGRAGGRGSR